MIGNIVTNIGRGTTNKHQLGIILARTFERKNVYQVDVYQNIILLSSGKLVELTLVDAAFEILTEKY